MDLTDPDVWATLGLAALVLLVYVVKAIRVLDDIL
jgi:hypothetical protein